MTMLNLRKGDKPDPKLPRANNVAPAPAPRLARDYSPEALNLFQAIVDDRAEIERLKTDNDHWRSRALAAEEQIKRLETQVAHDLKQHDEMVTQIMDRSDREFVKLAAQRDQQMLELTDQRDLWRGKYLRIRAHLDNSASIILAAIREGEQEGRAPAPKINLEAIAAEIEKPNEAESKLLLEEKPPQ